MRGLGRVEIIVEVVVVVIMRKIVKRLLLQVERCSMRRLKVALLMG